MKTKSIMAPNIVNIFFKSKLLFKIIIVVLLTIIWLYFNKSWNAPIPVNKVKVVGIVDGDTFKGYFVNKSHKISRFRLVGIDTPESVHPTKARQCYSLEAKAKLYSLINNKEVNVEFLKDNGLDQYDRYLVVVFLNKINVNNILIKEGFARKYIWDYGQKYAQEFVKSEKYAQQNLLGIWKYCN